MLEYVSNIILEKLQTSAKNIIIKYHVLTIFASVLQRERFMTLSVYDILMARQPVKIHRPAIGDDIIRGLIADNEISQDRLGRIYGMSDYIERTRRIKR